MVHPYSIEDRLALKWKSMFAAYSSDESPYYIQDYLKQFDPQLQEACAEHDVVVVDDSAIQFMFHQHHEFIEKKDLEFCMFFRSRNQLYKQPCDIFFFYRDGVLDRSAVRECEDKGLSLLPREVFLKFAQYVQENEALENEALTSHKEEVSTSQDDVQAHRDSVPNDVNGFIPHSPPGGAAQSKKTTSDEPLNPSASSGFVNSFEFGSTTLTLTIQGKYLHLNMGDYEDKIEIDRGPTSEEVERILVNYKNSEISKILYDDIKKHRADNLMRYFDRVRQLVVAEDIRLITNVLEYKRIQSVYKTISGELKTSRIVLAVTFIGIMRFFILSYNINNIIKGDRV